MPKCKNNTSNILDVIHTVGPVGEQEGKLRSCYTKCLNLVKEHNLKSVVRFM